MKYNAPRANIVVTVVLTVLFKVSLIDLSNRSFKGSFLYLRKFYIILSKITTVSFIE